MSNSRGFTMLEVLIAALILSMLVLGAMATMRSATGFTVMAGRQNEAMGRSFESWEPVRNNVSPVLLPPGSQTDHVPLTNVQADRKTDIDDPAVPGETPNSTLSQMREATTDVDWKEPR